MDALLTFSHAAASMPPSASVILRPLSSTGLWLAVTHTPMLVPAARLRSAANMPMRRHVLSMMLAFMRKPAVP
jgi:hypothetical protein